MSDLADNHLVALACGWGRVGHRIRTTEGQRTASRVPISTGRISRLLLSDGLKELLLEGLHRFQTRLLDTFVCEPLIFFSYWNRGVLLLQEKQQGIELDLKQGEGSSHGGSSLVIHLGPPVLRTQSSGTK